MDNRCVYCAKRERARLYIYMYIYTHTQNNRRASVAPRERGRIRCLLLKQYLIYHLSLLRQKREEGLDDKRIKRSGELEGKNNRKKERNAKKERND